MSSINKNSTPSFSDWTVEAEELQHKLLLAASEGETGLQRHLFDRLVPGDFLNEDLREKFIWLRDKWFPLKTSLTEHEETNDDLESNLAFDKLIERLARLVGAIRTRSLLDQAAHEIENDPASYDAILKKVNREINAETGRLTILKTSPGIWQTSRDRMMNLIETVERIFDGQRVIDADLVGWADLPTLNKLTGNFQRGRFYLIGGDGKTAFLAGLARSAAIDKRRVGIISLRDSEENIAVRLLGGESWIDPVDLRKGKIAEKDFPRMTHTAVKLLDHFPVNATLFNGSLGEACVFIQRLSKFKALELILVDDLEACGADPVESIHSLLEKINQFGMLARELNLPLVGTASFDAQGILPPGKNKMGEAFRLSNADFIAILRQIPDDEFRFLELQIVRNALGPTTTLQLFFNELTQRYYEVAE